MFEWLITKAEQMGEWIDGLSAAKGATMTLLLIIITIASIVGGAVGGVILIAWIVSVSFDVSKEAAVGITLLCVAFATPLTIVWHHIYRNHPNYRN